jgi:hypothetical protein
MFRRKTFFIIGAGASAEFDMPVGSALIGRVANAVSITSHRQTNDPVLAALIRSGFGQDRAENLLRSGPELATVASQFLSMDAALHFLSDAPETVELGKLAIAHEMMKAERNSKFYAAQHGNEEGASASNDSWASTFLKMALDNTRRQDISRLFDNVTIIDFNYDRVLPQFLYWALQRNMHIVPDQAAECVRNLRILHPYGSLGNLEWSSDSESLPFGADQEGLAEIASRIRTYTEEARNPEIGQIQSTMAEGTVFVVIGFGFHRQKYRYITSTIGHRPNVRMFMTVYGIPEGNHVAIRREMALKAFRAKEDPQIFGGIGSAMLQNL